MDFIQSIYIDMENLILFILVSFGFTGIMTQEVITKPIRKILNFKPFTCANCFAWWSGFIIGFFFQPIIPYISPIAYGFISYTMTRIILAWLNSRGEITIDD